MESSRRGLRWWVARLVVAASRRAAMLWPAKSFRKLVFESINRTTLWGGTTSVSGLGSTLEQTAVVRAALPGLLRELGARSMLDAPCGDFAWMCTVDLGGVRYTGVDIVAGLVDRNQAAYGNEHRCFRAGDLVTDALPAADVVCCRDCLVHLSDADILAAFLNFRRSGATWLLTTTFPALRSNADIGGRVWRAINLQLRPFGFPPPLRLIHEGSTDGGRRYADKSLGVWRLSDLPVKG